MRALINSLILCLATAVLVGCAEVGVSSSKQDEALAILRRIEVPAPTDITSYEEKYFGKLSRVTFSRVGDDYDADVTADGRWMVFTSTRNTKQPQIYMKNLSGGTAVIMKTNQATPCVHPSFSPDGKWIAYASYKNGNYDIWVMPADRNGAAEQITSSPFHELHPSWSPDGKKIVFMTYSETRSWNIQIWDSATTQVATITQGMCPEWSPVPGDETIVFQKARKRDIPWFGVWTVQSDGTQLTEVVAEAEWAAIDPSWSRDARYIVFTSVYKSIEAKAESRRTKGDDIWIVARDGTRQRRLTSDSRPDWSPRWACKDRIYFSSTREGHANVWSVQVPENLDATASAYDELMKKARDMSTTDDTTPVPPVNVVP